jgi:hypothetical protein
MNYRGRRQSRAAAYEARVAPGASRAMIAKKSPGQLWNDSAFNVSLARTSSWREYQSAKKKQKQREAREGSPWLRFQRNLLNQYLDRGGKDRLKIRPMLDSLEGKSDKDSDKEIVWNNLRPNDVREISKVPDWKAASYG